MEPYYMIFKFVYINPICQSVSPCTYCMSRTSQKKIWESMGCCGMNYLKGHYKGKTTSKFEILQRQPRETGKRGDIDSYMVGTFGLKILDPKGWFMYGQGFNGYLTPPPSSQWILHCRFYLIP